MVLLRANQCITISCSPETFMFTKLLAPRQGVEAITSENLHLLEHIRVYPISFHTCLEKGYCYPYENRANHRNEK